ncbi:hypothetical protein PENTCL1PPCAC_5001, partial [Pristionchus entomophagus]
MRILLLLLLSCTGFANAGCGCEQVHQELDREKVSDANSHGCRNCKTVEVSAQACPSVGYDCSVGYGITTNVLSAAGTTQCLEARCSGTAKLAHEGIIVNKVR